ncbi:MAG: hypothetical protein AAB386_04155 [Patescibacteria group bacterium]
MTKKRWTLVIAVSIIIGLAQVCFFSLLPTPWREFLPVLPIAAIFLILNRPTAALVFAGTGGFIVDLFSPGVSKFAVAEYLLIIIALAFILESVLTNRSVYVMATLVIIARTLSAIWEIVAAFASNLLFKTVFQTVSVQAFFISCAWDVFSVAVLFFIIARFTRRFLTPVIQNGSYEY